MAKEKEDRIFGVSAVKTFYESRNTDLIRLFVREGEQGKFKLILSECAKNRQLYRLVSDSELDQISQSKHHEGICAIVKPKKYVEVSTLIKDYIKRFSGQPLVILDGVSNPHNIGAVMRSAAFFGFKHLVIRTESIFTLGGALGRISEGGVELMLVSRIKNSLNLIDQIDEAKINLIVSDPEAELDYLSDKCFENPYALVFGNEGFGVSKEFKTRSKYQFCIAGSGKIQSLNIATSAGIIFNEVYNFISCRNH